MEGSPPDSLVLGVDPGLQVTGYALVYREGGQLRIREAGVLRTRRQHPLEQRLAELHRGIREVIEHFRPSVLALENLYSHYQRPQTAILMGHARGVICLAAAQTPIPLAHYAATQVKKLLTGNGHAPKRQIQEAIQREFGLQTAPEPADVADSLAIAVCHFHLSRLRPPPSRTGERLV